MSTPSVTHDSSRPDSHYQRLHNAIPAWLGKASSAKRAALSQVKPVPLRNGTDEQHAALKRLNAAHWSAQNAVDDAFKQLQTPSQYARAILEEALLTRYGLQLNSQTVYLHLYIPLNVPWFGIPSGAARTWTVSLLDAALHNFEHGETIEGAFEPDSTYITQPSAGGQFDTLPAIREKIAVTAFTRLCRELDIGARYQAYLREQLGMAEPVGAAVLRLMVDASQKAALRAALQVARIQGDINEDYAQQVEGLLDGRHDLKLGNLPLRCHDLRMMEASLTGILLLAPDLENTRSVQRLVAYVPDDPLHPLKEYASPLAFKQALTQQLRDTDYQAFFSRFVAHEQRGPFFADLSQRLARITWHPHEPGSDLAPWRSEPTDNPKLQFVVTPVNGDVWLHLYQQKLDKILNDARTQAVSTAEVDRIARWARWDALVNVASSVLNVALLIVAPFIPGLGELMLGYMAYQLLDEVFEGVVDWAEGLPQEAFEHLMNVMQSLVQLGAFAAGSTLGVAELRKVLPEDVLAFFDRFKPVTLANNANRYWKPDLAPYQHNVILPPRLGTDRLGLHQVRGESMLPLEGKLYAVQALADGEQHVIKHPTRADAYTPRLQHNGAGAWHTELEEPLQWDRSTLLRRLGQRADDLSEADRHLALSLSGVNENALRKMHVRGEPIPPLLEDTLERLRLDRSLQTLIDRLNSEDPTITAQIDPQDILQLLTTYGDWPKTRSLRMLDAEGNVTWQFGDMSMPVVQVHEAQLANGELLMTVLQALTPEEIRAQFGERAADPQLSLENRVRQLRKKLAQLAERNRAELFESRYAQGQLAAGAHARHLIDTAPGLPAPVAARVLDHANGHELEALDAHRTPPRLADLARGALTELRVNRAYEGQHLASTQNIDTDRLALNSLKLLAGWSAQIRLEARHLAPDGEAWLQVGPEDASIRRSLVRTAMGDYVPHDDKGPLSGETDLYTAILNALPDAQRDALGIGINQGPALKQRLRLQPLERHELRQVLGIAAPREPALETLLQLGSDTGYPAQPARGLRPSTLHERAHRLYPALNEHQIEDFLNHLRTLPGGAANEIAALAQEYAQLQRDLRAWEQQVPTLHPRTGNALSAVQQRTERRHRLIIASRLRRCWRRESRIDDYYADPARDGHILRLDTPILGELPQLTANFDHVSLLTVAGSTETTGLTEFLTRFSQLRHLRAQNFNLGTVPPHVYAMPRLTTLDLSECNITLTPTSQAQISALSRLQTLVLFGNPLRHVPSVRTMPALAHIDLSKTGIDHVPDGLFSRPDLQLALLSGNQLRELPAAIFERPPGHRDEFDFNDNPLSRATLEQVKTYFQHYDTYWEVDAPATQIRDAQALFPRLNQDQLNRLIYGLPGSLEDGEIELARLASDLSTLQQQLAHWELAPNLEPKEFARRIALRNTLEKSWRREPLMPGDAVHALTLERSLLGELPPLSVSFRHITALNLEGSGQAVNLNVFLDSFPALRMLNAQHLVLGDIPSKVFERPQLGTLVLKNCSISLSADTRAALERLSALRYLDLSENPLGTCPDFSRLPGVSTLCLNNTGLDAVPPSLLNALPRQQVNLSANVIEQLPAALFNLPESAAQAFDLSANPLSGQALEHIKRYCQRTREYFNAQAPAAQRARTRRLYPKMNAAAADSFVFGLPGEMGDIDAALGRLEVDYERLVADLQEWAIDVPAQHPNLRVPLDEASRAEDQLNRLNFKRRLVQAWRRESAPDQESLDDDLTHTVVLDMPIMGALPQLRTRFNHVTAFEFNGEATTTHVDGTLGSFPALQTLRLSGCTLGNLPSTIFDMPDLTSLELRQCAITLNPTSAHSVSDLHGLDYLDLSQNPLVYAPDVSHLGQLSSLYLHNTRITELPVGVFQLSELIMLDLSHNQIREMTPDLLGMQQNFDEECDLSNNPWSAASLEYLRDYYRKTGIDFNVTDATTGADGTPLQAPLEEPMEEE